MSSSTPRIGDNHQVPGAFPDSNSSSPAAGFNISSQRSLSQAIHARRAEYVRPRKTRVKVGTWNVAAKSGVEKDVGGWFVESKGVDETFTGLGIRDDGDGSASQEHDRESVAHQEARATKKASTIPRRDHGVMPGGEEIGLYVLGLQEVVDVTSPAEALRPYGDSSTALRWKLAMAQALPAGYRLVAEQQLVGLLLLIYASPSIAPTVTSVSNSSVGTGLMGYMGNKGAVSTRLVMGETTRLVFINSHLAAGADRTSLERRNWDAAQVLARTTFEPVNIDGVEEDSGEIIGDEDVAWWFGDLNYRLEGLPGADVRRLLLLHTSNEYDIGQASERGIEKDVADGYNYLGSGGGGSRDTLSSHSLSASLPDTMSSSDRTSTSSPSLSPADQARSIDDPTSLQATLVSLLPHDQLHQQQAAGKMFHDGWQEGPISFLPTYKYDIGSVGIFDSSEKRRGPSWCDRVLYRTRTDLLEHAGKAKEANETRKRDEEMEARGIAKAAAEDDAVLFDYDPETDGADDARDDDIPRSDIDQPDSSTGNNPLDGILQLDAYTSHQRVLSSDHKPVTALFTLSYDAVEPGLRSKVHQDAARELDKAENESRPGITIVVDRSHDDSTTIPGQRQASGGAEGSDSVDFGDVCYMQHKTRGITLANTSQVPATVSFLEQPGSHVHHKVTPRWLDLRFDKPPYQGTEGPPQKDTEHFTIEPGEAVNVVLDLRVDDVGLVRDLNHGREQLETVLVLRVTEGRDYFLPVYATWLDTCFGRSLDELLVLPTGGARALGTESHTRSRQEGKKWTAPKEIVRLTETIEELIERVVAEWEMTDSRRDSRAPWENYVGWPFKQKSWTNKDGRSSEVHRLYVREALDTGVPLFSLFPDETNAIERLEVVADVLVSLLKSLEDGIVTEALWTQLEQGVLVRERSKKQLTTEEEREWVLDVLSAAPNHNISFVFLTSMLARAASEVAPLHRPTDVAPASRSPAAALASPKARSRRRALSHDPVVARRQVIDEGYAKIFSRAMIRGALPAREKERKVAESRRREIIEVFLRGKWNEQT